MVCCFFLEGNTASFEFIRAIGSGRAINGGDSETGTFIYNAPTGADFDYEGIGGFPIQVTWPYQIGPGSYIYTAINDTSGEIVMTSSGFFFHDTPPGPESTVLHSYWSNFDTDGVTPIPTSSVRMLVTFDTSGNVITSTLIRLEDPERPFLADFPTVSSTTLSSASRFTVQGQPLPVNYNPNDGGFDEHSKLSIIKIGGTNIEFTDDNDPADSFSTQCTSVGSVIDTDDIGELVYRNNDGSVVINGASYTYDRIINTDDAALVLTGGTPHDGIITLTFTSVGSISQNYAGNYVTPDGKTGSFIIYSVAP